MIMDLTIEDARERVKLGAALLDAVRGDDWRSMIDVETLDIASVSRCVLGQIYGYYHDGTDILRESVNLTEVKNWTIRYGFAGSCNCCHEAYMPTSMLDQAWREYLTPVA